MFKQTLAILIALIVLVACVSPAPTPAPTAPPTLSVSSAPNATSAPTRVPIATPKPASAPTATTASTNAPTATGAPTQAPPSDGMITLTILHTNDMHGYLEGEKLVGGDGVNFEFGGIINAMGTIARLKQEAAGATLTFDDGDLWQGTFASNRDEAKSLIAAMNIVGYDALTLGNHDFDHGLEVVKARAAEAQFPFLAANLIQVATDKTPAWAKPYTIKSIAGLRVGIIGLVNSGTPGISSHARELKIFRFVPEVEALKAILPQVQAQADLIIVLSHNGWDREQQLAQAVPGIDVIISGHTHVEQRAPKLVNGALIVHAGSKAQYVGRLELKIDPKTKKIVDYTKSNEPVAVVSTKSAPPKAVADLLGKLVVEGREATTKEIGETLIDLTRLYTADGRSTGEYPSGNLVVDAMLAANQAGDQPAELALHNNAGIRADIPKGPLTYGKLYEMLPFDNVLTAMDLTGAQIKTILEQAASCPRVNILVAGISFKYDCAKRAGQRVSDILIQGKPLDPSKVYRVQTIDYLAGGGDGQVTFTAGKNLVYGDPVIDVVVAYVIKNSPINPRIEGRIVEAGK